MKRCFATIFCLCCCFFNRLQAGDLLPGNGKKITIVLPVAPEPRVLYGVEKLAEALKSIGYNTVRLTREENNASAVYLYAETPATASVSPTLRPDTSSKESFALRSFGKDNVAVQGTGPSGTLYGCLELAERITRSKGIPSGIDFADQPEMVLRGACIGLQKPYYLPGRTVYEYPYTEETFPWFYDKQHWIAYLDSLAVNRMNSLYLWNGHPFASLVKLKDYPYALEVDEATFQKNETMYKFIAEEADKRGIWIIQMFYNIIVSKPFAEKHGIKTQDRERPIIPLIADYTRKSIAAFVEKYPNVGLLVTLGEAMEGVGEDDVEWFTKTIIPGVKDGLRARKITEEPPIVLRAHDSDAPRVMDQALKTYRNLYTMAKYNGEALTTYTPRGTWAELHRKLSAIGTVHIQNVHILANLEPFRYASADFIQKSVQAMHNIYGSNGLHLYPQASYWDWPYAADSAGTKLFQVERDWLWYKQWARYAWNCHRPRTEEIQFWNEQLAGYFGMNEKQAAPILKAMEETGEIAPKLLRRFGITDGNRQTLTLGMQMSQLVNPTRFGLFTMLYESEAPEGESLAEYTLKDTKGEKHIGETPWVVINDVKAHAEKAVEAIEKSVPFVSKNTDEFDRWKNDVYCYRALAFHYAHKAEAALAALRYKYSKDVNELRKAIAPLKESVRWYDSLTQRTKGTYRYANSMQTAQRKIPFRGVDATYINWYEVQPHFINELKLLEKRVDSLAKAGNVSSVVLRKLLAPALVKTAKLPAYSVRENARPFSNDTSTIFKVVPELKTLKGIVADPEKQQAVGTEISFTTKEKVHFLVGFFTGKQPGFLPAPELETNATANDFGQAEAWIANGVVLKGLPPVNVHAYTFPPGKHTLRLAKGKCLLLGFVKALPEQVYDAGLSETETIREVDWIFE